MDNFLKAQALLLYPQTFLDPKKGKKIFPYIKTLVVLKLPETKENWEFFYRDLTEWRERVKFLEFKADLKQEVDQILKEVKVLEEWGYNFRTAENLRYFSQFKELVEESLIRIIGEIKGKESREKRSLELKQALITLVLAEKLDLRTYEIEKEWIDFERRYQETFKEKVIGEDFSFRPLDEMIKIAHEPISLVEELPGLKARERAWRILGDSIEFSVMLKIEGLLVTSKELFEEWRENYKGVLEETKDSDIKILKIEISSEQLLGFSIPLDQEHKLTRVFLLT